MQKNILFVLESLNSPSRKYIITETIDTNSYFPTALAYRISTGTVPEIITTSCPDTGQIAYFDNENSSNRFDPIKTIMARMHTIANSNNHIQQLNTMANSYLKPATYPNTIIGMSSLLTNMATPELLHAVPLLSRSSGPLPGITIPASCGRLKPRMMAQLTTQA